MRVKILTDSQEEFEAKRPELLKRIGGDEYEIVSKALKTLPRTPKFQVKKEMLVYWSGRFKETTNAIKKDIEDVLNEET